MTVPFFVFGLPRSRTKWLSEFLSPPGKVTVHDLLQHCTHFSDFTNCFVLGVDGTVTNGLTIGYKEVRRLFPHAKFVVVRRKLEDSQRSFDKIVPNWSDERKAHSRNFTHPLAATCLDALSAEPGVTTIQFDHLDNEAVCAWLYEHCLEMPHDHERWERFNATNIQVNFEVQRKHLAQHHAKIDAWHTQLFRASEPHPRPAQYNMAQELIPALLPELRPILPGFANYAFGPITQLCLDGLFKTWTVRVNHRLVATASALLSHDWKQNGKLVATPYCVAIGDDLMGIEDDLLCVIRRDLGLLGADASSFETGLNHG